MFIQNKKEEVVGTFPLSEILNGKRTKNFGETYSDVFENVAICLSKTSLFVSPKFFGLFARCSLKTIATFLENVAINKKSH